MHAATPGIRTDLRENDNRLMIGHSFRSCATLIASRFPCIVPLPDIIYSPLSILAVHWHQSWPRHRRSLLRVILRRLTRSFLLPSQDHLYVAWPYIFSMWPPVLRPAGCSLKPALRPVSLLCCCKCRSSPQIDGFTYCFRLYTVHLPITLSRQFPAFAKRSKCSSSHLAVFPAQSFSPVQHHQFFLLFACTRDHAFEPTIFPAFLTKSVKNQLLQALKVRGAEQVARLSSWK